MAVRVNGARASRGSETADRGNSSAVNADVARMPGRACAVDDASMRDDDVERRSLGGCAREHQQRNKKNENCRCSPH